MEDPSRIKLHTYGQGFTCGILTPAEYVFRAEDEWESVFKQAFPGRSFADHGAGYDFSKQMIIAVFLGKCPWLSAVKIEQMLEREDSLEIKISRNILREDEPDCCPLPTARVVSPYQIAITNKSEKEVRFEYYDNPDLQPLYIITKPGIKRV